MTEQQTKRKKPSMVQQSIEAARTVSNHLLQVPAGEFAEGKEGLRSPEVPTTAYLMNPIHQARRRGKGVVLRVG